MSRTEYYEKLKRLAREKRQEYGVVTSTFGLREVRQIYKAERVTIDKWDLPSRVKAVYMCDDGDCSVAVKGSLPEVPRLFALVHELKHHYCDQSVMASGKLQCGDYNANEVIEIGAEVFAAEFIYPQAEFLQEVEDLKVTGEWNPGDVVKLKKACKAMVSYTFLLKRLRWFKLIAPDQFKGVRFQKLEDRIYGPPIYRQPWFRRRIAIRRASQSRS